MADHAEVEKLLELPYFKDMFDKIATPLAKTQAEIMLAQDEDSKEMLEAAEHARKMIWDGIMGLYIEYYTEHLDNYEVDFLSKILQNPTFMKIQNLLPDMMADFTDWYDKNSGIIFDSINSKMMRLAE